ncbi:MATE family efflux transporter [Salinibacter altiplanensis]|uniref:MATE family efflux transporter n=1 Tax=Salinibacter altiplanensis TaxID=1803181 RepID=UPI001E45D640|nr:MATE family efflux transporter [Salinibacter altiplanensis]
MFSSALYHELRATLRLAGPVVAAQLAHISMSFVDTVMVGRLGPEALAGVALGHTVFFFFAIMGMGMVRAVGPLVSQAVGAEAPAAVGRSARQGLWLAGGLGVVILLILSNVEPVLRWTGQGPAAIEDATTYLDAIRWGILPFLGFAALRSFVEGLSRPLPVTIIAFIGVGVNIGANELLMFGYWGVPALGLAGTGWASTIVFSALFGLLALFVYHTEPFSTHGVFARLREPDLPTLQELVRVGAPMGASRGVESSLFMVTTVMMGTLGTTALAAHQVALQCAAFAFMVPLGIGMAGTVRVGQAAGAQDEAGARRAGGVAMGLATLFMAGTAILFWTLPRPIVGLYLDLANPGNTEVVALAVQLLGVAAVFQLFDGLQVAAHGALQGLKDTRVPMGIAVGTYWGIGLVTGYLWGVRGGGGPEALWWGLVTGLAAASVLLLARFHHQVERAVEEEAVPTASNGSAPAAASMEVPVAEEKSSG